MDSVRVGVEVGGCKLDNDGCSFLDYSYEIRLNFTDMFGERTSLSCSRSLLDFCDLESRLMKTLAEEKCLSPFHQITMAIRKKHMVEERREGVLTANALYRNLQGTLSNGNKKNEEPYASSSIKTDENLLNYYYKPCFGGEREEYMKEDYDTIINKEELIFKSTEVKVWMVQILKEPVILESLSFGLFFSEEEECYRRQNCEVGGGNESEHHTTEEYFFLLPQKNLKTKTVISKFVEKIEVQRGQIVVWRFSSKHHDVAFSVFLNGRSLLGAKKYSSSSTEIFGSLEMTSSTSGVGNLVGNGICEVRFDNKYAKLMTPTQVKFNCRAVDPMEYIDSKRRAAEKAESYRKKKQALESVTSIFGPRAAYLREEITSSSPEMPNLSNQQVDTITDTVNSIELGLELPEHLRGDDMTNEKSTEEALQLLSAENSSLRAENEALKNKCVQLQNKIDVVLNFANANSGKSSSSGINKASSSKERHQRRQTFASTSNDSPKLVTKVETARDDSVDVDAALSHPKAWDHTPPIATVSSSNLSTTQSSIERDLATDDITDNTASENVAISLESESLLSGVVNIENALQHHAEVAVLQKVDCDSDDDEDSD